MHIVAMNHRCREHTYQARESTGLDTQKAQINSIKKLDTKGQPHDKHQSEWHYRTAKEPAFP